jgi:hypothetical protein
MEHSFVVRWITELQWKRSAFGLGAAAVLVAGAVMGGTTHSATPPKLSGSYAVSQTKICPSSLVISIAGSSITYTWNDVSFHVGTATFTPSKPSPTQGTVTLSGWKVQGSVLAVNGGGDAFVSSVDPNAGAVSYTVTSNSLTINGTTYNAVHGVISGGIIQQFMYVGLDGTNNSCAVNAVATIQ